jgi:cytochrome b
MNETPRARILVWDWPVRAFHWSLALAFALAYALGDSEKWRNVHVALGYGVLALIGFRLVWGIIGTRPARFAAFIRSPRAAARYLAALVRGQPAEHTGHNPAGGWAIVGLLLLGLATGASGWLRYQDIGGERLEDLHEALANAWLALVALHVVAVIASSLLHRENLARAMLTGRKRGLPAEGARRAHGLVAVALVLVVGSLVYLTGGAAPGAAAVPSVTTVAVAGRNDED